MLKRLYTIAIVAVIAALSSSAQIVNPVEWTKSIKLSDDKSSGQITFVANIKSGWHLYGMKMPQTGPKPTRFVYSKVSGAELVGSTQPSRQAVEKIDEVFNLSLTWWEGSVTFTQDFKPTGNGPVEISGEIEYMACSDKSCTPVAHEEFTLNADNGNATVPAAIVADTAKNEPKETVEPTKFDESKWWNPVVFDSADADASMTEISTSPWWYIFIWGFIGGLLALLTPCVWPMIPLTVSFFLKKSSSRRKSVRDAIIYGISIVVIYLVLGLAITIIFGASKLNELSTNAVFNLIFFGLLVLFAVSFLGAFDITLPSRWSTGTDSKAEKTSGFLSIFFMAFTLVLVSFSCTGPIIGTLLVEAASIGNLTGPAIGMGGFALALALPFALFALFPSWLKEMPKSGGWLNSVKVVLGFLELALSLKFLSVADLAYGWHILDREVFISLWVVIFALLGFYLLGKIQFPHDTKPEHVSVPRFFMALASLSFAIYLIPGLWGAPLKSVSAFVPPLYTQDFNLYESGRFVEYDNFDEGMRVAAEEGKPVLIDFSGYGCVNCRKMEGAVFDTPQVERLIKDNFVLIKLYVDDKTDLKEPYKVVENNKTTEIRTNGDRWSYLQRHKFNANSQPYYAVLDNNGQPLAPPSYYDESIDNFVNWLQSALSNYK